ncbi:hypothetical protein FLM9_1075 [Candidatus Synechococcus spongiarum]|uniref:Uncharacterized protein n=1 Tax=Candidatus Synechococcus spongiarum TaxID=431041 RepID=A0A165AG46_9SYNE|nr:hypothetical protein FLM9_1075 [Candidatus Synechococcus spongiarum]
MEDSRDKKVFEELLAQAKNGVASLNTIGTTQLDPMTRSAS